MKKRVLRILPSYLLIGIPYFVWKDGFSPDVLYDVSGVSFLAAGRLDAWFPVAILLFYCLTPLLVRLLCGKRGVCSYLVFLSLCVVLLRFSPYVGRTAIMWSRLPAYALGILCALNRTAYRPASPIIFLSSGIVVAVFALTPLIPKLTAFFGSSVYRLFFLLLIFPIIILYNAFADHSRERGILRRFFALCGNVSLELYLIHLFLLYIISFYGLNTILYPLALVAAIPLACFVAYLTKPIE